MGSMQGCYVHEIETTILNIDRKVVEKKILSLGARKIFDGDVEALFFDYPDGRLRNQKVTIRLRKIGEKAFLTAKRPGELMSHTIKSRDEHEAEVSDFGTVKKILESTGLSVWLALRKHRTSYAIGKVHFEFDKHHDRYSFVPEYLEIEAPDEATLHKYAILLGFRKEDCTPWTILDIAKNMQSKGIKKSAN
jgi:predicted adenylyl cyclase CyaB